MAEVTQVTVRPMRQRRGSILEATISDGQSSMSLTFFNQQWRERQLTVGRRGLFAGQLSRFNGKWQLAHPEFELLPDGVDEDPAAVLAFAGALIPIYPASKSVASWQVRKAVDVVLDQLPDLPDPLPESLRVERGLLGLVDALRAIHRPTTQDDIDSAVERLRFEEAFVLQVLLAQRRAEAAALPAHRRIPEQHADQGRLRRTAALRPHGRAARGRRPDRRRHGARPSDAPTAPGRRRQRQDGRGPAGHAPGRRRRGTGGSPRAHRGARGPAPPIDQRDARPPRRGGAVRRSGHGDPGGPRHGIAARGDAAAGAARRRHRARRASSSAPMPCWRTPSPSATSGSSSWTSSTGSAWSSGQPWRRSRWTGPGPTSW